MKISPLLRRLFPPFLLSMLCLGILVLASKELRAQSAVDVELQDPAYRYVDKLVAFGLVDKFIYGQRPYSRLEVVRIALEAESHLSRLEKKKAVQEEAQWVIAYLKDRFPDEVKMFLKESVGWENVHAEFFDQFWVEYTYLDSPPRPVPPINGVGFIQANVNPLVGYRGGRQYLQNSNLFLQFDNNFQFSKYFSAQVTPYFLLNFPNEGMAEQRAYLQRLYGKFGVKNVELTIGRNEEVFGQGPWGGPLLGSNVRPLDMIRLTSVSPFYLPWVFRYMGAHKYTLFVSNLGPDREFPNSFMVGFAASLQPIRIIELGFYHTYILGGEGSPSFSWTLPLREFFWVDNPGTINPTDHRLGLNMRIRIPPLRNTQLYFDWVTDDIDFDTPAKAFIDAAAYLVGVYIPRIDDRGNHQLRLEFHYVSPIYGRNSTFTSGYQLNGFSLGDELASDAMGAYLTYYWYPTEKDFIKFHGGFEIRKNNLYTLEVDAEGRLGNLQVIENRPNEKAVRGEVKWERQWNDLIRTRFGLGYERVFGVDFVPGNNRNNFLGSMEAIFSFGKITRLPNSDSMGQRSSTKTP